jgi:hypothetical protein
LESKQGAHDPFSARLHRDDVLAAREHDAADGDQLHLFDHLANDDESVLANLAVRRDVIRTNVVKLVDLVSWDKLVDVYSLCALQRYGFQLLIGDFDILSFADLVALNDMSGRDFLARAFIHFVVADPIACLLIKLVEADLLALAGRRKQ